ncbi:ribokinase [Lysinibacter sp. HNR]|uniref:ribokinase n=1 Tax=Lysinibacter sp. HNR TaxID=3031408 RepID=UPI002435BFBC|nr:ribokinase [Lysinibacter sp. HNR]WGD38271.1 ribokinase [Lysinibacter sp. HNR]
MPLIMQDTNSRSHHPNSAPRVVVVGSINTDLVARVQHLPSAGETIPTTGFARFSGGKGSNQAIAAARLGQSVALIARIGDDEHGETARRLLTQEGVSTRALRYSEQPTGLAFITVDRNAENHIVIIPGANATLSENDIHGSSDIIRQAVVVVCQYEVPLVATLEAARLCRGTFILNPAPAGPVPPELLALTDVLVVNETEYLSVFQHPAPQQVDAFTSRARTQLPPHLRLVVTLGERGAYLWNGQEASSWLPPSVSVTDTTGAGDTFVGALADSLANGNSLENAVQWAIAASALSVQSFGATTAMPNQQSVRNLVNP